MEKPDEQLAKRCFNMALQSVAKMFTMDDDSNYDYFDLQAYFDEMVFGIHCTVPKYEYLKSLAT